MKMKEIYQILICIIPIVTCKIPLYVGSLFVTSEYWFGDYGGFFPTFFQDVFDEIANRSDILSDYHLFIENKDTKAIPGLSAKKLMEFTTEMPPKIAIIGPAMSTELSVVGQITPVFNLIEMSFVATTSTIKDRSLYSSLYTINYIQDDLNPLRIAVMKYFRWERVATIIYDNEIFHSQIEEFHGMLIAENFTLLTSAIIRDTAQTSDHIKRLKQYDARIIFGAFRTTTAPYIFCEAHKQGLYGRKYVWILSGEAMYPNWISGVNEDEIPCSKTELIEATKGHFTLSLRRLMEHSNVTYSGKTPQEYSDYVNSLISGSPYRLSRTHPWAFDTAWALALGLNNSLFHLQGAKLEDFDYNRTDIYTAIKKGMDEVSFEGVSGPVSFKNGRRMGYTYLEYNVGDNRTAVAVFNPSTSDLTWETSAVSLFEGSIVPKDRFTYITKDISVTFTAIICIILINTLGVFIAVGFLLFNFIFRNNRNIKMSSPRINNIIIFGCIVMYLSVYIDAVDAFMLHTTTLEHICMVKVWVMCLGFTIAFGALFSKTWRVHVLFRRNDLRRKRVKDSQLMGMCFILLVFDLVILTAWTIVDPLYKKIITNKHEVDYDNNMIETFLYRKCYHEKQIYWLSVQFISKGLLLSFGTFLAWETRMVIVPALNDSKLIGFCVYNIIIMSAFGVPMQYTLPDDKPTVKFILISMVIIFCTTMVPCILFIPKLKLRNQTENLRFYPTSFNSKMDQTNTATCQQNTKTDTELVSVTVERQQTMPSSIKVDEDDDSSLQEENQRLRMKLANESIAIAKLRKKILTETGNIHFHKVGDEYVIFRINTKTASETNLSNGQSKSLPGLTSDARINGLNRDHNPNSSE